MNHKLSRRRILRAGAALTVGLPFLPSIHQRASASTGEARKRFVVFLGSNGVVPDEFFPSNTGSDFTLPYSTAPLEALRDQLMILDGIDSKSWDAQNGNPHTRAGAHTLTCAPHIEPFQYTNGPGSHSTEISIDQEIAKANPMPIGSLQVGYDVTAGENGATPRTQYSSLGYNQPLQPQENPQQVFDQLSGFVAGDSDAAAAIERLRLEERSILDLAMADIQGLQPQLGAVDSQRLEKHLTRVRELEQALADAPSPLGCNPIDEPGANMGLLATTDAMRDLMTLAFTCDMTRVATFQWGGGQSAVKYGAIGVEDKSHHGLSHNNGNSYSDPFREITKYQMEAVASFASGLADIEDGEDCTVLDNTVVLYVNSLRTGYNHNPNGLPIVVVGGSNLGLKGNQSFDFDGASLNDLYITLANATGVPIDTFGDPQWVDGGLPQLLV